MVIKIFVATIVLLGCQSFQGNLPHMQVSQLTNQCPVVAVMGSQSTNCVMYITCNFMGCQLAFLKIEINLYLQFWVVSLRNTVKFMNEIDHFCECQLSKLVQNYLIKH